MPRRTRAYDPLMEPDIIAFDRDDEPVLAVNTTTLRASETVAASRVVEILAASGVPFGMFVNLDQITIFRRDFEDPAAICTLESAEVFKFYQPEFDRIRITPDYLRGLVRDWLDDLAYHWKSPIPPAVDRLESIGLAERLAGGTSQRGGHLADPPLH